MLVLFWFIIVTCSVPRWDFLLDNYLEDECSLLPLEFCNVSRITKHLDLRISRSDAIDFYLTKVETGGGSPADVARSYMKDRPPWASPGRNVELRTPLTVTMKLFKEGTLYSAGHDSMSSSKVHF